uniref:AcidPPc domain-containing protein n=1 Tax=Syphacia muris TaxID=451379 RepID=A0A0N5AF48_9BILA
MPVSIDPFDTCQQKIEKQLKQRQHMSTECSYCSDAGNTSELSENYSVNIKADTKAYLKQYPMEKFPNWSLTNEAYYVQAPIDRYGEFAFHLRSHLTALILAGNPAIEYLQRRQTPFLTFLALIFSKLGLEEFFFSLVTSFLWLFDARLGRILAALLALGFTVSGSIKVLLCLPRPPVPPAVRLSEEDKDWAWPSNHALTGTIFPWFIWIYASNNYQLSFFGSLLLLLCVLTWNAGVIWSRVYLGVHSPCDVAAGWVIGVILLFISVGFCSRVDDFYLLASTQAPWKLSYFTCVALLAIYLQPRTWPETQSIGEVCCIFAAAVRFVSKPIFQRIFLIIYKLLGINYYSFSSLCKICPIQPDKRYSPRMRFKPTSNKFVSQSDIPYDIDLPVKFAVYSILGFTVSELCPVVFKSLGI